ncbi:predicted protein [Nematostella vectensis]|uniref:Uncharacterized protein n=1 Tax=Nematostella vectensis TaxID=45351 RepID=A7SYB1_NEMVE|nr:uncharacterized protein LOC5502191 [Nematostella vectensis]EDO31307.1 predicted protein [Nematostella vectensis]|eukprot:XP_001623407.1 predicted protein [Nematostella vectensis]
MAAGDGDVAAVSETLQSMQQQAKKFFEGMQMVSGAPYTCEDARADLFGLSSMVDTLSDNLVGSGLYAIPVDSEIQQLDCQATVRKGLEDAENNRISLQRVQMNSSIINRTMLMPKK